MSHELRHFVNKAARVARRGVRRAERTERRLSHSMRHTGDHHLLINTGIAIMLGAAVFGLLFGKDLARYVRMSHM